MYMSRQELKVILGLLYDLRATGDYEGWSYMNSLTVEGETYEPYEQCRNMIAVLEDRLNINGADMWDKDVQL